jgi:hypothetical protein
MKKDKKAQVTIFVIISILLISSIVLIMMLKPQRPIDEGGKEETNVRSVFESCLEVKLKETVKTITEQGGYLENPLNIPFKFDGEEEVRNISYLCYTLKSYFPCTNQEPMLMRHLELEIGKGISETVKECFDESASALQKRGETVEASYSGFSVDIAPRRITVLVDGQITSTKTGQTTKEEDLRAVFPSRLYEVTKVVEEITNQEATYCSFEINGFMLFYPEYEINKINTMHSTTIYTVKHNKGLEEFVFAVRSCSFPPAY